MAESRLALAEHRTYCAVFAALPTVGFFAAVDLTRPDLEMFWCVHSPASPGTVIVLCLRFRPMPRCSLESLRRRTSGLVTLNAANNDGTSISQCRADSSTHDGSVIATLYSSTAIAPASRSVLSHSTDPRNSALCALLSPSTSTPTDLLSASISKSVEDSAAPRHSFHRHLPVSIAFRKFAIHSKITYKTVPPAVFHLSCRTTCPHRLGQCK